MDFNRCLERQHADEVCGPDTTGQTACSDPAPESLGGGFFHVANPFGHVHNGEAGRTCDQVSEQHQKGVMSAIKYYLSTLWKLGNKMQTKPIHSMPRHCVIPRECHSHWRMPGV